MAAQIALGDSALTAVSALAILVDDGHMIARAAGLARVLDALAAGARSELEMARAVTQYARAVRLNPASALALVNQGIAQAAVGDTVSAVASWQQAMRVEPGEPLAPFNLGGVLLLRGRFAEATAAYRSALVLDPGLAPAHFNLARSLASEGSYEPALRAIREGLRFDSTNAAAHAMVEMLRRRGVRR